jgi:hypothetical protein
MPVLPVIPDVFRVTLNWNPAHGVSPRNVMHFSAPSKTASQFPTDLAAAWQTAQWDWVQQDWAFTSVDILKLDGVSSTVTVPLGAQGSLVSGDWIVGACGVLSIKTAQRGSRGRGRLYLGPLPESKLTAGQINNALPISTAWSTFFANAATHGWIGGVASYVHADFHPLTSIRADIIPGMQRRRNNQQRA